MRKKERQLITLGLVVLFAAIAWWAYHSGGVGFIDLSNTLNGTNESETYQLAVSGLAATVLENGHVEVSFTLTNAEHFNISSVEVLYALNVADPQNATYTTLNATEQNGTYSAEIPSKFGDVVYYKVKVVYDSTKELVTDVQTITVTDTTAPTLNSVSIDYNSTALTFAISFNATDNDQIAEYIVHYAENSVNNFTNATFGIVNATTTPITISNITEGNYYAFWFEVKDLSGNIATLYNETAPLIIQANTSATWPVVVPQNG